MSENCPQTCILTCEKTAKQCRVMEKVELYTHKETYQQANKQMKDKKFNPG